MAEANVLEISTNGHVRVLRLNRPQRRNALSAQLGWSIVQAIEDAAADEDVWVIGITGAVDAFCSGLDAGRFEERFSEYLTQLAALSPIAVRQTKRALHRATAPPDVKAHAAYELVNARRGLASEAGAEALKAFMERRPAQYRGR
jgi:enoyl-CoA hydratase/carnithine racemase